MSTIRRAGRQRGLTIIELVLFIVITGVAAVGVLRILNIGGQASADPARRKQAMLIAEAYMEEVQLARFTYCDPADPAAITAGSAAGCAITEAIGLEANNVRPYDNVNDYADQAGIAKRSFSVNGVDTDVNGVPLGQSGGAALGNSSMAGITTTVTLNYVPALGPAGRVIASAAGNLSALRITVATTYGPAASDVVILDGYRTRYAPNFVP
jgi:MSHA pilin protein MshD